jgi:hypothetical protein
MFTNRIYQSFLKKTGLNTRVVVIMVVLTYPLIIAGNYAAETLQHQLLISTGE